MDQSTDDTIFDPPRVLAEPLRILRYPNPLLAKKAPPVTTIGPETRAIAGRMMVTMLSAPGYGLAATQIGVMARILTIDPGRIADDNNLRPVTLVNPVITGTAESAAEDEGCLSIPGIYAVLERPSKVRVEYQDLDGTAQSLEAEGYLARCIQHEMDHLDGILFWDRLSAAHGAMLKTKYMARLTWLR